MDICVVCTTRFIINFQFLIRMGTDYSKSKKPCNFAKYAQIYLQTDKSAYEAGETVTGKVSLNLLQPFPGKDLKIKLKGKEAVHLIRRVQQGKSHAEKQYRQVNRIIDKSVSVHSWNELLPGQYVIPFSFMLPSKIPSSFHQEAHRYFADITYKIEAIFEPTLKGGPRPKFKQAIVVRQPSKDLTQNKERRIVVETASCGCCSVGSTELKC